MEKKIYYRQCNKAIGKTRFFGKRDVAVQVNTLNLLFSPFWLKRTFECGGLHTEVCSIPQMALNAKGRRYFYCQWSVYDSPTVFT